MATCASRSPALRMQAVSCEISARSVNELAEGMYPSAIAQRLRPMASMAVVPPPVPDPYVPAEQRQRRWGDFRCARMGTFSEVRRRDVVVAGVGQGRGPS